MRAECQTESDTDVKVNDKERGEREERRQRGRRKGKRKTTKMYIPYVKENPAMPVGNLSYQNEFSHSLCRSSLSSSLDSSSIRIKWLVHIPGVMV